MFSVMEIHATCLMKSKEFRDCYLCDSVGHNTLLLLKASYTKKLDLQTLCLLIHTIACHILILLMPA
jgi:hypothetical protein